MCWVGWPFFFRRQHRQITGRLRVTVPTVPSPGRPTTSSYASLLCRNHFMALRRQRSARLPGQAPSRELWHDRLTLGCASKAALARGALSGHSRLTVHSSRRRFAARLNSRVRRHMRIARDFFTRSPIDQQSICENAWCEACGEADVGLDNPVEYEIHGRIFVDGVCTRCGGNITTELKEIGARG